MRTTESELVMKKLYMLAEIERGSKKDAFRLISFYVDEYKAKYGHDKEISDFVYDYLAERRDRGQKTK